MLLTRLKQQVVCIYLNSTGKPYPTLQLGRGEAGSSLARVTESLLIPVLYKH